jgi:hypothetical protein
LSRLDGDVPSIAVPPRTEPHADYRRQARRIRSVFRAQPTVRMRALRELAAREDERRGNKAMMSDAVVALPLGAAQSFSGLVREHLDGPVLRYSHRANLLRAAERSGIGRFEANLIIAAVQHQAGGMNRAESVAPSESWRAALIGFIATQGAILSALWWLIR